MRVLIVDLNNFARYPTTSVGYLTAQLRNAGHEVQVFCPLTTGVSSEPREARPTWRRRLESRIECSMQPVVAATRQQLSLLRTRVQHRKRARIAPRVISIMQKGCDVVLVSTYLNYRPVVEHLCEAAAELEIPVVVGGAALTQPGLAASWMNIKGLSAVVAGEAEALIAELVEDLAKKRGPPKQLGVWTHPDCAADVVPPLRALDDLPAPDFSDFPWDLYPTRLIPILASRGCSWGVCAFCSDVVTSSGRMARHRSVDNVLAEMKLQSERYESNDFLFLDLKLNGSLELWNGLIERLPLELPEARWSAAVHVGSREAAGLHLERLKAAVHSGCIRLTTGLESGSQRVLDAMNKGTELEITSRFLRDASAAGVSVRVTAMYGFPGEEAQDVADTAAFLRVHGASIDRVSLMRFNLETGTPVHRDWERDPSEYPAISKGRLCTDEARVRFRFAPPHPRAYGRALRNLWREVNRINCRPLGARARIFEGMM